MYLGSPRKQSKVTEVPVCTQNTLPGVFVSTENAVRRSVCGKDIRSLSASLCMKFFQFKTKQIALHFIGNVSHVSWGGPSIMKKQSLQLKFHLNNLNLCLVPRSLIILRKEKFLQEVQKKSVVTGCHFHTIHRKLL